MNDMEERAVLVRAYAAPTAAEVESALGLVKFRLPARRPRNWLGGLMKIAAALILLAGTFAVGRFSASWTGPATRAWSNTARGLTADNPFGLQPAELALTEGSSAPAFRPGSALSVPSAMRVVRAFHVEAWEIYTTGDRKRVADTLLAAEANSGIRIALGEDGDSGELARYHDTRVHADLTVHAFDDRVELSGRVSSRVPGASALVPNGVQRTVTDFVRQHGLLVRPGEAAWFYFGGQPQRGVRNVAVAVTAIVDAASARPALRRQAAVFRTGFGPVTVALVPRVQGVHLRLEAGDSTHWSTVFDRPRAVLTGIGQVIALPGTDSLLISVSVQPHGPICFSWSWRHRTAPQGARCFNTQPATQFPLMLPIHGSGGRQLRLTLLDLF